MEHTDAGDPIYVASSSSEIYLLAGRRAPTRFFGPIFVKRHTEEFRASVLRRVPTVIVGGGPRRDHRAEVEAALAPILATRYEQVAEFPEGGWVVYALRESVDVGLECGEGESVGNSGGDVLPERG